MAQNFLSQIYANHGIRIDDALQDGTGLPGTAGQILSSNATGVSWIDPSALPAGAAETVEIQVKNTSGGILTKGTPVYIKPSTSAIDRVEVSAADAGDSTKMPAVGLLAQDLNNQATGVAITGGMLTNFTTDPIDGSTPTSNDTVYVKVGGGLTLTKPTGATGLIQNIAKVGKVSGGNSGSLVVSSILRTNDVPNLPTGRIWVGDGNSIASTVVFIDETNGFFGINNATPTAQLDVTGQVNFEDLKLDGELLDQFNSPGANGMILQSLKLGPTNQQGINWVSAGQIVVTGIQENNNTAFIDVTASGLGAGYVTGPVTISAELSASGTPLATNFLSGDNTWKQIEIASGNTNTLTVAFTNKNVLTVQTPGVGAATLGLATGKQIYDYIAGLTVDDLSPPTADFDVNNNKILNLTTPTLADDAANKAYVDNVLAGSGALIYQGGYSASTNTPVLDNRGTQIAVTQGWTYTVTVDGTFYGETVKVGDVLIAETDLATGTGALTDWTTVQSNIDVATAGTSVTSVKGIAGFNEDDFTAVNGFVSVKDDTYVPYTGATTDVDLGANNLIVDTDTLFVNSSNNRVGIGELNPGYRLDVHTGAIGGIVRFSGDGSNDMIFKSESGFMSIDTRNTSTGLAFQIQGSEKVRIHSGGDVSFRDTSNNEAFYWDASTASLGIGTGSSPSEKLEVKDGSIRTTTLNSFSNLISGRASVPNVSGYNIGGLLFQAYRTGTTYATGAAIYSYSDGGAWTSTSVPSYLSFQTAAVGTTNATERMIINSNGNVGIGTGSSPSAKLHVKTTNTTAEDVAHFGNNNITDGLAVTTNGNLDWGFNARNTRNLTFSTNQIERMRIDSSGNVGIKGTGTKLGWERASDNSPNIVYLTKNEDLGVNGNAKLHGYDGIIFSTEGSETPKMTINSSGNVGIGKTAASGYKLDIEANNQRLRLLGTTGYAAAEVQNNGGALTIGKETSSGGGFFPTTGAYDSVLASQGAVNMVFGTNSAERMRITSGGNVGINETNPLSELHVKGSIRTTINSTAGGFTLIGGINGVSNGHVISTDTSNNITYSWNTGTNARALTINPSGNVGIGTDSPSTELHVKAPSGYAELRLQGASGSGSTVEFYDDATKLGDIYIDPSKNIVFRNASERMRITSAGGVSFGTSGTAYGTTGQVLTSTGNASPTWGGVTYAGLGPEFTDTDVGTNSTTLDFSTDQIFTRTVGGTYNVTSNTAKPGMVKQLITTGGSTFAITGGKLIAGSYDGTVTNFIQIAVQTSNSFWYSISQEQ